MSNAELFGADAVVPNGRVRYAAARLKYAHDYRRAAPSIKVTAVAFPEPRHRLQKELSQSDLIGTTTDAKKIYLFDYRRNSSVIRELGRLRELTFRSVGEGTQKLRDIDQFDKTYRHIILWDHKQQEIVGAYRIGEAFANNNDASGLYTSEHFNYGSEFLAVASQAVELGRSFIQPKYWTTRSLDYLWQGIGAYLRVRPYVRYLFGAVSISNDYSELAKQEIVAFHRLFYCHNKALSIATARTPYITNRAVLESYRNHTLEAALNRLKQSLNKQHVSMPVLYKHYVALCEQGGVNFVDFNVDPSFSFCIDGLVVADLHQMKESKRRRYLAQNQLC